MADLYEGLAPLVDAALESADIEELADLLVSLKAHHRAVGDMARQVEEKLAEIWPDTKLIELPGLPVMELRRGSNRTRWQSPDLFDHISRQFSIEDVKEALPLTGSLQWRTTKLRDLGLQVDEWCEVSPGRVSVQIHEAT